MEPLSAVGLASATAQFLDFGVKVFNASREIAADGSGVSVTHLDALSSDLMKISDGLSANYRTLERQAVTDEERGLIAVVKQCRDMSDEIQEYIADLVFKVEDYSDLDEVLGQASDASSAEGVLSKTDAVKKRVKERLEKAKIAMKTTWRTAEIEDLRKRHGDFSSQLALRLLFVLNTYHVHQSSTLEDIRGKSDEIIEAVALHSKSFEADRAALAAILTTRSGSQPTILSRSNPGTTDQAGSIGDDLLQDDKWKHFESSTSFKYDGAAESAGFSTQATRNCSSILLDALHFRGIRQRQEAISEVHEKTFSWILDSDSSGPRHKLLDWLSRGSGCFWVSGKAGSGKSSLLKYLLGERRFLDALETWAGSQGDAHLSLGSFYFWYAGTNLQKSHAGLLRGLLFQILTERPGLDLKLFPDICREILTDRIKDNLELSETELKLAFSRLMNVLPTDMRICFVIDGLDEYSGNVNDLCDLFSQATQSPSIKILLSSRPIPVCCERFGHCPQLRLQDLTEPDILAYVEDHLDNNAILEEMEDIEDGITEKLTDMITSRASGVFLWVVLVVRILEQRLQDYDSVSEIVQGIDDLPQDLEPLYERMLGAVDPRYRVQSSKYLQLSLLSLTFGAEQPMTPIQMYFAESEDYRRVFSRPAKPLNTVMVRWINKSIEGRLRSRCCGLLEIQQMGGSDEDFQETLDTDSGAKSVVTFIHRTVVEFLQFPSNWHRIQAPTTNTKFDAERALLSSAMAELQSIPASSHDSNSYEIQCQHSCLTRMFAYHSKMSESLLHEFYELYLPEVDAMLEPLTYPPEHRALVCEAFQRVCAVRSTPVLSGSEAVLFTRCALSSPVHYMSTYARLYSYPPWTHDDFLSLYFTEKSGIIRRRLVEALSVTLPPSNGNKQHWEKFMVYVLQVLIGRAMPSFDYTDPELMLALLDMALLMLKPESKLDWDIHMHDVRYSAASVLNKLAITAQFYMQLHGREYKEHGAEVSGKCTRILSSLEHYKTKSVKHHKGFSTVEVKRPNSEEVFELPLATPTQPRSMSPWKWFKSWVP